MRSVKQLPVRVHERAQVQQATHLRRMTMPIFMLFIPPLSSWWVPSTDEPPAHRNSQPLVWHLIAHAIPGRTNKDCRKRWHSKLVADVNKGPWTPDEDARLYNAVKAHGTKWVLVASQVETRNGDQCSKRWNNTVNPEIDHSSWTKGEVNST
jgi:hypothetical protein